VAWLNVVEAKLARCGWANQDPMYVKYHDEEWGIPKHDDNELFELLILEGMQAGLSWYTILKKRENFRKAFDSFDPKKVAKYNAKKVSLLLKDAGLVRNHLKIQSAVTNAKALLQIQKEFGSFDDYIWRFVGGAPRINSWETMMKIPAKTAESDAMSKDLSKRGFKFVGSTICYAFMQATGMVDDHLVDCFKHTRA
jgi:DNA-3-methyladenine glycosylase I